MQLVHKVVYSWRLEAPLVECKPACPIRTLTLEPQSPIEDPCHDAAYLCERGATEPRHHKLRHAWCSSERMTVLKVVTLPGSVMDPSLGKKISVEPGDMHDGKVPSWGKAN